MKKNKVGRWIDLYLTVRRSVHLKYNCQREVAFDRDLIDEKRKLSCYLGET